MTPTVDYEGINFGSSENAAKHHISVFETFKQRLKENKEEYKKACTDEKGRLKHILSVEHFDLEFLEKICHTAKAARRCSKLGRYNPIKNILCHKIVLNYFSQPSTRTFLSFSTAEAKLGIEREEIRDIATSSYAKGESEKDSLRMISSYFNAVVFRHPSSLYDQFALWVMKNSDREIPLINAGSGQGEHPTQALLDYYTMYESFKGNLDKKVILWIGDCKRGRTVHSGAKLMALHKHTTNYFIAPPDLQIDEATENYLKAKGAVVHKVSEGLKDLVPLADIIYVTRIQDEHGGTSSYPKDFIFTKEMLESMREGAILMHPLPKREEIEPELDDLKKDKRIMYWRQARNGMWVRVALLAYLFGRDTEIRDSYRRIQKAANTIPLSGKHYEE